MRIAYLCNLYPAVSHSFIRREIEGVELAGHEVHRFTLRPVPSVLRDDADIAEARRTQSVLAQGAFRLVCAWLRLLATNPLASLSALAATFRLSGPGLGSKLRHLAYLLEAAWLANRLRKLRIEHLHAHFGTNPAAVGLLVEKLGGPPFSFTVHGPDEFDAPIALSLPAKIQAASFVVAISSYGRSQLMRWCKPEDWDRIEVIRCGLDSAFLDEPSEPMRTQSTDFVCVARLSGQKGLPLLIAACDQLRQRGEQFSLTIIGDGELRPQLEDDIRSRKLAPYVRLVGVRSATEIRTQLQQARAFVLPSFAEGLPVVLMEALGRSRPVIATTIAGIPELVDNQCGWLIPAGSVQALVEAMDAALHLPIAELEAKAAVGRARVQEHHDARKNAAKLAVRFAGAVGQPEKAGT